MDGCNDLFVVKNVSYLRARDPSIIAFNQPGLAAVRTNLISDWEQATILSEKTDLIRVYLRIKNGYNCQDLYEISDNTLICNIPQGSHYLRNFKEGDSLKRRYTFTEIFHPSTSQTDVFNNVVKPKILEFINGQNSTLLTYGASGSGKTFTVIGTDEEPGVVPRSLEYLFRTLPQLSKEPRVKPQPAGNVSLLDECDYKKEKQMRKNLLNSSSSMDKSHHIKTYTAMQQRLSNEPVAFLDDISDLSLSVWVSFAEIYNEQIYDLLQPAPSRGKQRTRLRLGCSNGHTYIKNLTNISVTSGLEAFQILQYGIHNLNYASTNLNSHSSRSHSIFTIKLVQVSGADGGTYVSNFNFCDLAGSERTKKTLNVGERLKESNNINSSLLVLGRCISAIRDSQRQNDNKLVPFRESKLTQLFQKALAGFEDIAMIVNISSKREMFDETQHVLNFSAVAKEITIETNPVEKEYRKKTRFSQLAQDRRQMTDSIQEETQENDVEQLKNAVLFLQNELEQQRNEFEISEKLNRDYLIDGYEKLLKDAQKNADSRVKDAEAYIRLQYEMKINNLKARYEQEMLEKEQVIWVDSGDEEENTHLRDEVEELKRMVARLEMENTVKDQQIKKLTNENFELKKTINEGIDDYNDMDTKRQILEKNYWNEQNKCLQFEIELDMVKEEMNSLLKGKFDSECDSEDENKENISEN